MCRGFLVLVWLRCLIRDLEMILSVLTSHMLAYIIYIYIYIYIGFTKKFIYVCEMLDIYIVSPLYNSINFYE